MFKNAKKFAAVALAAFVTVASLPAIQAQAASVSPTAVTSATAAKATTTYGTKITSSTIRVTLNDGTNTETLTAAEWAKRGVTVKIPTLKTAASSKAYSATLTVTAGGKTFNVPFTYQVNKASQTVTATAPASGVKVGGSGTISLSGVKTSLAKKNVSGKNVTITSVSKSAIKVKGSKAGSGSVTIKVPSSTNYNAPKTITVKFTVSAKGAKTQTVKASNTSVKVKKAKSVKVTGVKTSVTYSVSPSNIATLSKKTKTGFTVTGKKAGTAYVTIKAKATKNYTESVKRIKITVTK